MDDLNRRAPEPPATSPPAEQEQAGNQSAGCREDSKDASESAAPGAGAGTAPTREPVQTVAVKQGQSANVVVLLVGAVVSLAVALIGAALWLASRPPTPQAQRQAPIAVPLRAPAAQADKPDLVRAPTAAPEPVRTNARPSPERAQPASPVSGQAVTSNPAQTSSRKALPPAVPTTRPGKAATTVRPAKRQPTPISRQQLAEPEPAERRWSEPDQMGSWYKFSQREGGN